MAATNHPIKEPAKRGLVARLREWIFPPVKHDWYTLPLDRGRRLYVNAPFPLTRKELDRLIGWLAVQMNVVPDKPLVNHVAESALSQASTPSSYPNKQGASSVVTEVKGEEKT